MVGLWTSRAGIVDLYGVRVGRAFQENVVFTCEEQCEIGSYVEDAEEHQLSRVATRCNVGARIGHSSHDNVFERIGKEHDAQNWDPDHQRSRLDLASHHHE